MHFYFMHPVRNAISTHQYALHSTMAGSEAMKKIAVIGSGLGGLTCAVILARRGFDVTLFERQPVVGGYAIQFKRDGFIFDPSLHSIPAGGNDDIFYSLICKIGVGDSIDFLRLSDGPEVLFGKNNYRLPNEPKQVFEYLTCIFPDEERNIVRFFRDLNNYSRIYCGILMKNKPLFKSLPLFLLKLPVFLYQSYESTDHFLKRYFKNSKLRSLLFQYAIFIGIPMDRFPAVNFIVMVSLLLSKGMYTISGGGGHLTDVLFTTFVQLGGKVKTSTEIRQIELQKGKAAGVRDSKGNFYPADAIAANTNPPELAAMVPPSALPAAYKKALTGLKPSLSIVQLHLGLDCHVRDAGIGRHLYFCFPHKNVVDCLRTQQHSLIPEGFSVTAPGITDPESYRNNTRIISVAGAASGELWMALDETSYRVKKEECTRKMLAQIYEIFPALQRHVMVTDCATPRTFSRYTGNPLGALMGFDCTCGTHRRLMSVSKFPVKNIVPAGAWTDKLGGYMQSIRSGVDAAEKIATLLH